jgi:N-acetylglutamate synthase-like GNAT family acetyltransferase
LTVLIREYRESDRPWAEAFMSDKFGGPLQARRGELMDVLALPWFIAERDDQTIGLAAYRLENDECEIAFIATLERHAGVGSALLNALLGAVSQRDRKRRANSSNLRSRQSASSESRCATKSNSSCGRDARRPGR